MTAATTAQVKVNGNNDPGMGQKIINQIEYYFGDINLPRDKFIQEEMKKDNGWVPLSTMLKFNRLAAITTNIDAIVDALRSSHLIDLSEDNLKIRRNPEVPLPDNTLEYWQEVKRRTVYLKGFPQGTTLDDISGFVCQFGTVQNIVMRHTKGSKETPRIFKGSAFVTYSTQEQAKQVAALGELKFKGEHELVHLTQDDYWAKKQTQRQQQKDLKRQMKKTQIEQQNKAHYKKGMVLKVSGLEQQPVGENGVKKEESEEDKQPVEQIRELKCFFESFGRPAFVDINGNEATIRFNGHDEFAAKEAWEKAVEAAPDGKVVMNGLELTGSVLEGDEESKYYLEFDKAKAAKSGRQQQQNGRGGNKRGDRDRVRNDRKRRADQSAGRGGQGPKGKRTVFADDDHDEEELAEAPTTNGATAEAAEEKTGEPVEAKKPKVEA